MSATTYRDVVFMMGDDAREPLRILHHKPMDDDGVLWECPTEADVNNAIAYLADWDNGEGERLDHPRAGASDWTETAGDYVLTYNVGLGYIGLEKIERQHEQRPIDYDRVRREAPALKAALTRARKSGDPAKVRAACVKAVRAWETWGAWPDNWSTWQVALNDSEHWTSYTDLRDLV